MRLNAEQGVKLTVLLADTQPLLGEGAVGDLLERGLNALPEELSARARRFRRRADQANAVAGKALLLLAGKRNGVADPLGTLLFGARGKPFWASGPGFNLTHCTGRAALAVARCELGIDMERMDRIVALDDFASCLGPGERERVAGSGNPRIALLELWTMKESAAKAVGLGLGLDPATLVPKRGRVRAAGQLLHLTRVEVPGAWCHVATPEPVSGLAIREHAFEELVLLLEEERRAPEGAARATMEEEA